MNKLSHVAFIMDGNGRWGIKKKRGRNYGHLNGVKTVKKVVETSVKLKVPIITFYVFSTENWKRPKSEINFLFSLIMSYFKKELENVVRNKIKINIVGKLNNLPKNIQRVLKDAVRHTKDNRKIIVNLAVNYGSREEIINAAKKITKKTEKNLEKYLYTKELPNPDILIRTGGYKRLSNFMLWQLAYTELYFLDKLWPDFNEKDYEKIIKDYKKVQRNFGSI